MRHAIVTGGLGAEDIEMVRSYLPSNYSANVGPAEDPRIRIVGEDDHGWTLDGYVIPRLRSGLIAVRCVIPIELRWVDANDIWPAGWLWYCEELSEECGPFDEIAQAKKDAYDTLGREVGDGGNEIIFREVK
jgi:hypothetical protein